MADSQDTFVPNLNKIRNDRKNSSRTSNPKRGLMHLGLPVSGSVRRLPFRNSSTDSREIWQTYTAASRVQAHSKFDNDSLSRSIWTVNELCAWIA